MPFGYPVFLELAGRHAVVIGETAVREGKVEGLLAADVGSVTVVAERPAARLESLAALDARVTVERRAWRPADAGRDVRVRRLVGRPCRARAVAREARDRGVLVNVMDDIPNCDWAAPSIVRRGELVLAISTGGASPALARKLRLQLSAAFGEEWAEVLAVLRDVRAATMPFLPDIGERASAMGLRAGHRGGRRRSSARGRADELRERLVRRLLEDAPIAAPTGIVYLVGAGPGDPGAHHGPRLPRCSGAPTSSCTTAWRLRRCSIWRRPRPSASTPARNRADPRCRRPRSTRCLVERALDGQTVVRLKGGDPFVFGRGGEELLACIEAGVACEVVPGITSAIAAPALAGIPVTHRGVAQSFAVVTGSTAHGDEVDLARVATSTDTLVVLMAAGKLAETCAELIAAGQTGGPNRRRSSSGRRPRSNARSWEPWTTCRRWPRPARIGPPATLVVGAVVALDAGNGPGGSASRRRRSSLRFRAPGLRSAGWNRRLHRLGRSGSHRVGHVVPAAHHHPGDLPAR